MAVFRSSFVPLLIAAFLLCAACGGTVEKEGPSKSVVAENPAGPPAAAPLSPSAEIYAFQCMDGFRFTASVDGPVARLFLPDQVLSLRRMPSLSGGFYSDGPRALLLRETDARLELTGEVHRGCDHHPGRAVWEHARLAGVDFRAIGNEPGWHLEITEGENILLAADYGLTTTTFPYTEPEADAVGAVRYLTAAKQTTLEILIEPEPCTDTMSGEKFPYSVTVFFSGRTLAGCGRKLP